MSRRKQSNPKPLKNELPHGEFSGENEEKKDTSPTWTEPNPPTTPSPTSGNSADATMVTVLDAQPIKSETPPERPRSASEDDRKSPSKAEQDEKRPRIRLKAALATDPALSMMASVKSEVLESSPEYLASLSPALQTALASRGLLFPGALNLEAVAAMAQRAAAITTPSEPSGSSEATRTSVPIYQCVPCGIRFSSLSTLEAHQTYYCSHRPNKPSEDDPKQTGGSDGTANQSDADPSDPNSKNVRVSKQYTCMHCSYSADKKVSLNRHMRMHTVSPVPAPASLVGGAAGGSGLANGDASGVPPDQDRYCAECDIRFSSQKTFRAHKMHYCNSRHVVKSNAPPSSCTSGSSPTSPVDPSTCRSPPSPTASSTPQQHFLALPTNPIIIVPYSLFKSASVLPSLSTATGFPSPDTPCFLMPNGTLQPMTSALTAISSNATPQGEQVLKAVNKSKEPGNNRESSSAPLDLTVRRSPDPENPRSKNPDLDPDHEKENLKHRSPSPEKIECEPSIQGSPCSTPSGGCDKGSPGLSHSPKRKLDDLSRSNSPRSSKTPRLSLEKHQRTSPEAVLLPGAAPFEIPSALHPLLLRSGNISALIPPELQMRLSDLAPIPPVMPQVIVKQGVSKCKECNIVFCKHENYLIHKKHYCSSRSADDDASKNSGSPPVSPRSGGTTSPATQYQQLICLACGIKFTSPDNLNAHQQYYCLKRGDVEPKRCAKCRGIFEPGHQCVTHTAVAGWKCPCCDVISATASAAQRHMESHQGVKAYLCNLCGYKGNTLRGMKTHIRMHFHKRSPDLQEENYISYILDDDRVVAAGMEIATPPAIVPEENLDTRPDPHLCPHCPYTSPYKANVVRHVKLVHESEEANGEGTRGSIKEEEEEIIVKKEAMEPEIIIAPVDGLTIKEEPDLSSPKGTDDIVPEVTKPGAHYCKSCNIYFTYPNSFIAHKKFYCSSHAGEISNSNNNNNTAPRAAEASVL